MRRVWIAVICLVISSFAAAQDSSQKRDAQTDALAKQTSSDLRNPIQHINVGDIADDAIGKIAGLAYDVHMSDCENRWVALYHRPKDADYTYAFVYIDPHAGFTVHYSGRFTIDAAGNYHAAPNPLPPDKVSLKIRLDQNGIASLLPDRAVAQLQLPQRPDWMKYYEDGADPVTHKVSWGFFYNGIGDSQRALGFLESAYKEKPDAPRVVFELTYAYNATGRPEDAIRIAKSEFAKKPNDEFVPRDSICLSSSEKLYGRYGAISGLYRALWQLGISDGREERVGDEPQFGL